MHQRALDEPSVLDRENLVKLIRTWGDVNTDGLLDKSCQVFAIPNIEGFIGYKIESSNVIVLGDPVCSLDNRPILANAFSAYCRRKNLGVIYSMVSQDFTEWATGHLSAIAIEFGSKFILDPQRLPTQNTGSKAVLVRKKVKHAVNKGVVVHEYLGDDPTLEKQIEGIATTWLQNRKGPQVYLCDVNLFQDRYGKRWFYAQKDDKIVGLLVLNELQSQKGWLLNNVMIVKEAPTGLSELLIISALETLNKEDCQLVVIGPIPLNQLKKISGLGKIKSKLVEGIYKFISAIFGLGRHATFWDKFQPQFKSSFVIFPDRNLGFSSIKSLMKAFHVGKALKNNEKN